MKMKLVAATLSLAIALAPAALAGKPSSSGGGKSGGGGGGGGGKHGGGGSGGGTTPALFNGHAVVLDADILGIRTVLSEAGPIGTGPGETEASLLDVDVLGLVSADALHATTIGQADRTRSEATVADLSLNVANVVQVSAGFIESRAMATCSGTSGSSDLLALTINGQSIHVTGKPNQTLDLLLAKVVINEQIVDGNNITVNALHVTALDALGIQIADVVVSSAEAGVDCSGGTPGCEGRDFITGGGFITAASGQKGNFAIAGGHKQNGDLWGHMVFIDHGTGMKAKYTSITAYEISGNTRIIRGTATANGQAVTFVATAIDNGEPGTSDYFQLDLSNGYSAGGTLDGGNIQLHKPCQ